jgi:hypothetical protein
MKVAVATLLAIVGTTWGVVAHSAAVAARDGASLLKHPPAAVERWTGHLSLKDTKEVIGVACKLSEAYVKAAEVQRWTDSHRYSYGEDKVRSIEGLVKEMRGNPGAKVVCAAAG